MTPALRKAAFLDRDGIINQDTGYIYRVEDFVPLEGMVDGLRALQDAGYALVVITNQSGIARGYFTQEDYDLFTRHIRQYLLREGITLTGVYHCPHLEEADNPLYRQSCACRKPKPGMLMRAAEDYALDIAQSILIGDRESDIAAGRTAGVRLTVQLCEHLPSTQTIMPDHHVKNWSACVDIIRGMRG